MWFPIQVDTPEKNNRLGVCQDCSVSGMLLRTRSNFRIGDPVKLTFRMNKEQEVPMRVSGKIVRLGLDTGENNTPWWPNLVGIRFQDTLDQLEPLLVQQEAAQREQFVS